MNELEKRLIELQQQLIKQKTGIDFDTNSPYLDNMINIATKAAASPSAASPAKSCYLGR